MKSTYKVLTLQVGRRWEPLTTRLLTSLSLAPQASYQPHSLTHLTHMPCLLAFSFTNTAQKYKHAAHRGPVASATHGQHIKQQDTSPVTAAWATVNLYTQEGGRERHTRVQKAGTTHTQRTLRINTSQQKPRQGGKVQPHQHSAHTRSSVHVAVAWLHNMHQHAAVLAQQDGTHK